jgi:hypothetical protein
MPTVSLNTRTTSVHHLPPFWAFNLLLTAFEAPFAPSGTLGVGAAARLWRNRQMYSSKGIRRRKSACKLNDLRYWMCDCTVRRSIKPRLGGFEVDGCNAGAEGGIGRGEWVRPFGIPFCVASEVEAFGTGVSGFRPPVLPFGCDGRMVAVDELAVRERLCPCPGLGSAGVAVCVEAEEVEELRERDGEEGWGDGCRLGVGSIVFWYSISRT